MAIAELTSENILKIYYYLAIFSTILFTLKLIIFAFVGGDSEVAGDFNSEMDTDCSFNFVSTQSVIAFLMGFGWMGYSGLQQLQFSQGLNLAVAFCVGFIFMFVTAALMFGVKRLEKKVEKTNEGALNQVGKAYTSFEPNGRGQVEIEIDGQLRIVNATNTTKQKINSFDSIKVIKVVKDMLYIEKSN